MLHGQKSTCYQNVVFGRVAPTNMNLALLQYMFNFFGSIRDGRSQTKY